VELTSRCNRSCVYCYNQWRDDADHTDRELPPEQLGDLINRVMDESGFGSVQLTGGEPLLYPGFIQLVESIRAPGRKVSLVTDGGLLDETMVEELKRLKVAPVQPTLLAARREVHNELKGTDCFNATVSALALLRRLRVPVSVSFVCTRRNYQHFRDVVELCFSLGVRVIAFSRFCSAGRGGRRHDELAPDSAMIASCLEVAEEANARLGMKVTIAISLPLCAVNPADYPNLAFGRCAISTDNPGFTMDPDGKLKACSISSTVLGDLRTEAWNAVLSRARKDYFQRMSTVPDDCVGCALVDRCGGGCRESVLSRHGDLNHPDPLWRSH